MSRFRSAVLAVALATAPLLGLAADSAHASTVQSARPPHVVKASGANSRGFVLDYSNGVQVWYPSLPVAQRECRSFLYLSERNACYRYVTLKQYPWLNRMVRLHPRYTFGQYTG